jgi:GntR family transcriptional repressor for pyruvate dehydrogenase complex
MYLPVKTGKGALSHQVAEQILRLVAEKQLKAGSQLPPLDELCVDLGVSRTVLREAIKLLDAWGVLTVRPGVGTFVAGMTSDVLMVPIRLSAERSEERIRKLHQLRESVEDDIAAIAATTARPEHIAAMESALMKMDQSLADPNEFVQADLEFHSILAQATGNDLFVIVIHPVIDLLQDERCVAIESPGAGERAQTYHRMILKSIKAGDAGSAREAMRAHLNQVWEEIESQLRVA